MGIFISEKADEIYYNRKRLTVLNYRPDGTFGCGGLLPNDDHRAKFGPCDKSQVSMAEKSLIHQKVHRRFKIINVAFGFIMFAINPAMVSVALNLNELDI